MDTSSGSVSEGSSARRVDVAHRGPSDSDGAAPAEERAPAPVVVRPRPTSELVAIATQRWRETLVTLAGPSSLTDIELLGEACLDLSGAHPSGMAQLFAGRATRLSNVFRDSATLPSARRRARLITQRSREQAERFGVAPTFLAIGVATWREHVAADNDGDDVAALARVTGVAGAGGADAKDDVVASDGGQGAAATETSAEAAAPTTRLVRAPVLLRPVTIRPRGEGENDYELTLEPNAEINPVVARALRSRGALLDPAALARSTFDGAGFHPGRALDRVDALGQAVFDSFHLTERVVVGTFLHPGQQLVDDLDELTGLEHHEVVAALAGSQAARDLLDVELPEPPVGDVEPNLERGVGDLDPSARHVLEALATGSHLFVDAPVGADTATVLAAVVAEAAAIGRNVLYVPGHRRASSALKSRLRALGLDDLVLDVSPQPTWRTDVSRRLLAAMTTDAEPVDVPRISRVRRELTGVRRDLSRTIDALHAVREAWGVSAYQALQSLVRLTGQEPGPATRVRLEVATAQGMGASARVVYGESLRTLASTGGLTPAVMRSPWYGAHLTDDRSADHALELVDRLLDHHLVALGDDIETAVEDLGIEPPRTVAQWRDQIGVLASLRGSLDVFQPVVFERAQDDLVAATATKAWRAERGVQMGGRTRRQLVKHAKDLLRPGRHVEDLHAALLTVQARRTAWLEQFPRGGWPRLPRTMAEFETHLAGTLADLVELERVLAPTAAGGALLDLPLEDLGHRLQGLRMDPEALHQVRRASDGAWNLRAVGLGPLLDDLSARDVPPELVEAELELSWWSAVFDAIVASDPHLSQVDGAWIETLAARFRALDAEHVRLLIQPVKASVVDHVHRALSEQPKQADELFAELVDECLLSVRAAVTSYPDVVRRLRPVVVATPTLVPQLAPPHRTVDLVVIDAAQHLPVESVLSAIARGRQVVVVGDPRCASGSAVRDLAAILPHVRLAGDAGARDPRLTQFLADHGYAGALRALPLPSTESLVTFDTVEGTGMPGRETGTVEATTAEVDRVVALAVEAAVLRPTESLAIVASTRVMADLVREGVLAQVRRHPELAEFFDPRRPEPVVVADLAGVSGLQRDSLIYAVSFGRTPHGRVLHRFGVLGTDAGAPLLLNALGVTRHRLAVVSALTAGDLDRERLKNPGSVLLADLLDLAAACTQGPQREPEAPEERQPNRLVIDLAERLYRVGLTVETAYGTAGSERIPLVVGHPDFPGEMFVAVVTDDEDYVDEPSVRVRDRQRAVRLERLGWTVMQVWSVSLFLDPELQANRIRQTVLEIARRRREEQATTPLLTPWDAEGASWLHEVLQGAGLEPGASRQVAAEPVDEPAGDVATVTGRGASEGVRDGDVDAPAGAAAPVGASAQVVDQDPAGSQEPSKAEPLENVAPPATGATPVVRDEAPVAPAPTREEAVARASQAPQTAATPIVVAPTGALPIVMPDLFESVSGTPYDPAAGRATGQRGPRPSVLAGLPISAYSDDELDDLVAWLAADGTRRTDEELAAALRAELGVTRRNHRVDTAVAGAVARWAQG